MAYVRCDSGAISKRPKTNLNCGHHAAVAAYCTVHCGAEGVDAIFQWLRNGGVRSKGRNMTWRQAIHVWAWVSSGGLSCQSTAPSATTTTRAAPYLRLLQEIAEFLDCVDEEGESPSPRPVAIVAVSDEERLCSPQTYDKTPASACDRSNNAAK